MDPIVDSDSACTQFLVHLSNNFIKEGDLVMHMFRNSGKDYNDFGRYEDCESFHDFNYYMLQVKDKFPIPFTMGLCMPGVCSLANLNDYKPTFVSAINTAIPNLFENVKGFDVEA